MLPSCLDRDSGQTTELIGFFTCFTLVPNPTTGLSTAPSDVTNQGNESDGLTQGYRDPLSCLLRLASELGETRTGPQTGLRVCRLPVRPQMWLGLAHTGQVADSSTENT